MTHGHRSKNQYQPPTAGKPFVANGIQEDLRTKVSKGGHTGTGATVDKARQQTAT